MNTIQVTTEDGTVNYTEAEVLHFKKRAQEIDAIQQVNDSQRKDIRDIRNAVRDFFSEGEWSDGETVCNKGDVNTLLEQIGTSKLTTKYRGTFTITGSFELDAEEEDEVESVISENISVECYAAEIDVDNIEIFDIEEDN